MLIGKKKVTEWVYSFVRCKNIGDGGRGKMILT